MCSNSRSDTASLSYGSNGRNPALKGTPRNRFSCLVNVSGVPNTSSHNCASRRVGVRRAVSIMAMSEEL